MLEWEFVSGQDFELWRVDRRPGFCLFGLRGASPGVSVLTQKLRRSVSSESGVSHTMRPECSPLQI